jgi:ribonuclease-3
VGVVNGESRDGREAAGRDPAELPGALGVPLGDELLQRALTHRSYAYENGGLPTNERLEFLGDSVLGLVVTDTLFRGYPNLPEGQLAKLRAAVVNMTALAGVARGLHLGAYVRLGRGEEGTGGRDKPSILADTLEAVIGAVYIDCGLDEASSLVHRLFDPVIERSARLGAGLDWKTSLQELTAAELLGVPEYQVEESGPDHQKSFRAVVKVSGRVRGTGEGRSKKAAEQQAAEAAWIAISASAAGGAPAGGAGAGSASAGAQDATAGHAAGAAGGVEGKQPAGPARDPDARRPQEGGNGTGPARAEQAGHRAPSGSAPAVPPVSGQRGRAGARVLREP